MRRWPLIPTLLVAAAVATMIGLGIWQLGRMQEKRELIAQYERAANLPQVAWPSVPPADDSLLFRRAAGFCLEVTGWRATAGQNAGGEGGWSHIASCSTGGLEGPGMQADMGWSKQSTTPAWRGGEVAGVIVPDSKHRIRLVSSKPAPGLEPSAPPSPDTISNNHLLYAIQWFFFAAAAAVIYVLALKRRRQREPEGGGSAA